MVLAANEEEQGIAAELQQLAAPGGHDLQHRAEDPVERLDDLLGPDPPAAGQPFGERGETGDVCEDERSVQDAPQFPGSLVIPGEGEWGYVAAQVGQRVSFAFH